MFRSNFISYVDSIKKLKAHCLTSHPKVFSDIFESIVGAVYIDSGDIKITTKVTLKLILPYIKIYTKQET